MSACKKKLLKKAELVYCDKRECLSKREKEEKK